MTPEQLYTDALEAKAQGTNMSLVIPKGHRLGNGFPRGELLCETDHGRVKSFSPDKIIAMLIKAKFITPKETA